MASFINNRLNKLERVIIFYYKEEEYMISVKDMAGLVYVYDAYITINKALFGNTVLLCFNEGNFEATSRIFNVIERNIIEELKKNDCKKTWDILDDFSLKPEERAKKLLGE